MSQSNRLGLLGRKVGMMRLFTDDGDAVPVTVVDVSNNRVTQVKTQENDGYVALQVTFGARKASRVTKPQAGHLAKAGVEAGEVTQEFHVTPETAAQYPAGSTVPVTAIFNVGEKVDVHELLLVRVSLAPSSVTISVHSALLTVTAVRTMCPALYPWHKTLVVFSLASVCLATWETKPSRHKTCLSFASTKVVN